MVTSPFVPMITPLGFLSLVEQTMKEVLSDGAGTYQRRIDFVTSCGTLEILDKSADALGMISVRAASDAREPCLHATFRTKDGDIAEELIFSAAPEPRASEAIRKAAREWAAALQPEESPVLSAAPSRAKRGRGGARSR